jgi:hypothetical protein
MKAGQEEMRAQTKANVDTAMTVNQDGMETIQEEMRLTKRGWMILKKKEKKCGGCNNLHLVQNGKTIIRWGENILLGVSHQTHGLCN